MRIPAAARMLHHGIQPLVHIPDAQPHRLRGSRRVRQILAAAGGRLGRSVGERGLGGGAEGCGERGGGDAGR